MFYIKQTMQRSLLILILSFVISISVLAKEDSSNTFDTSDYIVSDTPINKHSAYRPLKKVLVGFATPELLKKMSLIMPDVEFVTADQLTDDQHNFDAVLAGCRQSNLIKRAPNAVWYHAYSAGVDACMKVPKIQNLVNREEGLILTNSSGTAAAVIAEHTIAMMMSMTRGLHRYRDNQNGSNWNRSTSNELNLMQTVTGKTMLVLGLGSIGQEVAIRANALGMNVVATRNSSRSGPDYIDYVGLSNETIELAQKADVIVNALPLTDSTRGFLDKDFFKAMRPTAYYISIGRGGTTDTQALLDVLMNKEIAGAALDVTDPEPLPRDHPLWKLDNVLITPHISGTGGESLNKTIALALENLRRYQNGEPMLNMVDTTLGY